jgi:hypothetical protein
MGFLKAFSLAKLSVVLLVAVFFARYFLTPGLVMNSGLHGFILVLHEAGHILMTFFGEFFVILGGTFWQLALPIMFALYFVFTHQLLSASLVLFLVAFSFVDASIYVSDAQARELPLITFDKDTHDWWNLLLRLNLLHYDSLLGTLYYLQGLVCYLLALYLGVDFSRKEPATPRLVRRWVLNCPRVKKEARNLPLASTVAQYHHPKQRKHHRASCHCQAPARNNH